MLRPRIIPCLLVHEGGLVKTVNFKQPKYVGDPINAVKIFNEKEADELMVLDIDATADNVEPDFRMITNLAAECRMPLCYGGGIKTTAHAKKIIGLGVEKIAIGSMAVHSPDIVSMIANEIGSQSVVVVIDILKKSGIFNKGYQVCTQNGKVKHNIDPIEFALKMQKLGVGEIVINSIDNDGQMKGYDYDLAVKLKKVLSIPLTFLGGAGSLGDIEKLVSLCGVIGASAGSLFVFKGIYRAVLISYPNPQQREALCVSGLSLWNEKR